MHGGYLNAIDNNKKIRHLCLLTEVYETTSALFTGRNLETVYHLTAWSAIPKSPRGIQLHGQVTNPPPFIFIRSSFPPAVMASRHGTKRGLCQRDPLLALMRGPGRRGTPGPGASVSEPAALPPLWPPLHLTPQVFKVSKREGREKSSSGITGE